MVPSSTASFCIGCASWQFVRLDVNILVALILYQRNGDTTPYGTQTEFWSPVRWVPLWWPIVFFSKSIWSASECPRQVAILNVPGPWGSVRLAASTWILHSFVFFFFFFSFPFLLRYFPFFFLLGQNAPVSDPHTLPLVNKSDGRCCCRTRSSSVRCMLFMDNWNSISFFIIDQPYRRLIANHKYKLIT